MIQKNRKSKVNIKYIYIKFDYSKHLDKYNCPCSDIGLLTNLLK